VKGVKDRDVNIEVGCKVASVRDMDLEAHGTRPLMHKFIIEICGDESRVV